MRGWLRLGRPIAEFWDARPWEIAAVMGVGPYRPEDAGDSRPTRGRKRQVGSGGHAMNQSELLRQRVAHARDPKRNPKPVAKRDKTASLAVANLIGGS